MLRQSDEDGVSVLCGGQDDTRQAGDEFFVRDEFVVHPRTEHIVDPACLSFVDEVQHRPRQIEAVGDAIQQVPVEDIPAESLSDAPPDFTATSAGFPRDRQVANLPLRRVPTDVVLCRAIVKFRRHRPRMHLSLGRGQNTGLYSHLIAHGPPSELEEIARDIRPHERDYIPFHRF